MAAKGLYVVMFLFDSNCITMLASCPSPATPSNTSAGREGKCSPAIYVAAERNIIELANGWMDFYAEQILTIVTPADGARASAYPPAAAPLGAAASLSFAPGALAPPRAYRFRFGPA